MLLELVCLCEVFHYNCRGMPILRRLVYFVFSAMDSMPVIRLVRSGQSLMRKVIQANRFPHIRPMGTKSLIPTNTNGWLMKKRRQL